MSYILQLLKEKPHSTFSQEELASIFNKSPSTISRNIKRLKERNLILIQKKGKFNQIQLNPNYTSETDTTIKKKYNYQLNPLKTFPSTSFQIFFSNLRSSISTY